VIEWDMSHGFDNLLCSFSGVLPEIVGPCLLNPNAGREETAKEAEPQDAHSSGQSQ
jgi:hypothetical protein